MSTTNTGGAAFPVQRLDAPSGMTLRDYFAAKALSALVVGRTWDHLKGGAAEMFETWATSAYGVADMMLIARGQTADRDLALHDLLVKALKDCVSVMDRELNGLAVIQPELRQARAALAAAGAA